MSPGCTNSTYLNIKPVDKDFPHFGSFSFPWESNLAFILEESMWTSVLSQRRLQAKQAHCWRWSQRTLPSLVLVSAIILKKRSKLQLANQKLLHFPRFYFNDYIIEKLVLSAMFRQPDRQDWMICLLHYYDPINIHIYFSPSTLMLFCLN